MNAGLLGTVLYIHGKKKRVVHILFSCKNAKAARQNTYLIALSSCRQHHNALQQSNSSAVYIEPFLFFFFFYP
jgi:DUF1365 family protein